MANKLKVLSVCSGVGGLDKPFMEDDRFEIIGFSETDKHAAAILSYHHLEVKNYGDLTKIRTEELPDFDILVGGTPCQSFSIAGKRAGFEGSSGLFSHYVRILKDKQPRYFIHENVLGMFSSTKGWDFARVQMELAEAGYDFRWEVLNAKEFGIPQNRERIFTLGTLRGSSRSEILLSSRKSILDYKAKQDVQQGEEKFIATRYLGRNGKLTSDISPTIQASDHPHIRTKKVLAWSSSGRSWGREERVTLDHAHTLNTGDGCRTQSAATYVTHDEESIRKLTPNECERLMSWQDNHTSKGIYEGKEKLMSDSQRYKMCGNGVVSACVYPIRDLIVEMQLL